MKAFRFLLSLLILVFAAPLEAMVEGKLGFFHPQTEVLQDIFGDILPSFSLGVSQEMCCLRPGADITLIWGTGCSIGGNEPTDMYLVPLTLSLDYIFSLCSCIKGYVGAGPRFYYLHVFNDSNFVNHHDHKCFFGGDLRAGCIFGGMSRYQLSLWIDYALARVHFSGTGGGRLEKHSLDVSGFSAGAAIGYKF